MDKQEALELISSIINSDPHIEIKKSFIIQKDNFVGQIKVNYLNADLDIFVLIPTTYPFTRPNSDNISIYFYNPCLIGYNHININGTVCFHPQKDENFERKLRAEIVGLKLWIKDYYILQKIDEQYSYLIHYTGGNDTILNFTNNPKKFKKDEFGLFKYAINSIEKETKDSPNIYSAYRLGFDDSDDDWSNSFKINLYTKGTKTGLWYFINEEPIKKYDDNRRRGIETWDELYDYFTDDFIDYLHKGIKNFNKNYFFENELFLMIGYKIPNAESYEVHWDLIKIPKSAFPTTTERVSYTERVSGIKYRTILKNDKIIWGRTNNIDYTRFFGRGKFCDNITKARILLIGCGALGSNLAELLVRGGIRTIFLEDFDSVGSGNICRANYVLRDIGKSKPESLKNRLLEISPFVNLYSLDKKLNSTNLDLLEKDLNENADIIFDCSTDPEVTYILDNINFKGRYISLGITNHANELICVTGTNLTEKSNHLYGFFQNDLPLLYEGAGCGYPTFKASFNDINCLINIALKYINRKLEIYDDFRDFVISYSEESGEHKINNYISFKQKLSDSNIYISKDILDDIKNHLNHHYPKEFGGVFVGKLFHNSILIEKILIPDDYKNGRTIFVRHPGTLNQRLKSIFDTTKGKVVYIGEWHSHPDGAPLPSQTDISAMKEISETESINITSPLLMIASISKKKFEANFYKYFEKQLLKYEQQN
ncbi:ThiF family adenylyltransferase [Flavobacterium sp. AG291]|uniref:ThiF family adenylyltransferase n=1 Tax=Flavobacterium sp. AG291 TaxID=2184000 RepID=UPI000E0A6CF5|nr:ThiF family adenylyltransferase [Flavobacterium sp. AG291]RDI09738.1 integrative and conjugative element protein (TIGR02256 family) [Flavobacterium sp. AG291]